MDDSERDTIRVRLQRTSEAARSSAATAKDAREARNAVIWEADAAGFSLVEMAKWSGYNVSTVHAIVLTPH